MRNILISLLVCTTPLAAFALAEHEDVPIYEGAWTMRLAGRPAKLVVKDWEGTWQETGPRGAGANPACRAKPYPISVHHSNPREFEFTAWGSSVSPACPDISFTVKPVNDKTMSGTTTTGDAVTMTRERRAPARQ
jgi:hypothetical protein